MNNKNGNGSHHSNGKHNQTTYQEHADKSNAQYTQEFDNWWAKLPQKTKRLLALNKVVGPCVTLSSTAELDHDAADTPAASYILHIELDLLADQFVEKFQLSKPLAAVLGTFVLQMIESESVKYKAWLFRRVVGEILNAKNVKLCAAGLAFAGNMAGIPSMRGFAKKIHLSHEAVSKVKRRWQVLLELPDSVYSKDAEARGQYSAVQSSERHWRRAKFTAAGFKKLAVTAAGSN